MRASTAFLVIFPMVVISTLFLVTLPRRARAADPRSDGLFWDEATAAFVRQRMAFTYVDTLSEKQQRDAFYRAMEAYVELDPYCDFINPVEYRQWQESTAGEYGGLGIRIKPEAEGLRVTGILPGGPASKAGLVRGDLVLSADGRSLGSADPKNENAIKSLKGAPGAVVRLVVRSAAPGSGAPVVPAPGAPAPGAPGPAAAAPPAREIVAVREVVRPPGVFVRRVGEAGRVGVLRIAEFSETTDEEFSNELDALVAAGVEALVVDLRDNVGGVLKSAVNVADRFLARGVIVRSEGRVPEANHVHNATPRPTGPRPDVTLPLVVLVNGNSASASEVVSGALQDHRRALLVGERTYGKFLIQQITEGPRHDCAVQLVTARYYTPAGRSYQRHASDGSLGPPPTAAGQPGEGAAADPGAGLLPDVVVALSKDEHRALLQQWDNEEDARWGSDASHPEVRSDVVDPQLGRALDALAGELARVKIRPAPRPRNG